MLARRRLLGSAVVLALPLPAAAQVVTAVPPASTNVVDTLAQRGGFTEFLSLIQRAGLTEQLRGAGPFIVFAPDDRAIGRLPRQVTESLLGRTAEGNAPAPDPVRVAAFVNSHIVQGSGSLAGLVGQNVQFQARNGNVIEMSVPTGVQPQVRLTGEGGFSPAGAAGDPRIREIEGEILASNGVIWPVTIPLLV